MRQSKERESFSIVSDQQELYLKPECLNYISPVQRERERGKQEIEAHSLIKFCSLVFTDFCVVSIISCEKQHGPDQSQCAVRACTHNALRLLDVTTNVDHLASRRRKIRSNRRRLTPCASKMSASFSENLSKHFCKTRRLTLDTHPNSQTVCQQSTPTMERI